MTLLPLSILAILILFRFHQCFPHLTPSPYSLPSPNQSLPRFLFVLRLLFHFHQPIPPHPWHSPFSHLRLPSSLFNFHSHTYLPRSDSSLSILSHTFLTISCHSILLTKYPSSSHLFTVAGFFKDPFLSYPIKLFTCAKPISSPNFIKFLPAHTLLPNYTSHTQLSCLLSTTCLFLPSMATFLSISVQHLSIPSMSAPDLGWFTYTNFRLLPLTLRLSLSSQTTFVGSPITYYFFSPLPFFLTPREDESSPSCLFQYPPLSLPHLP